MNFWQQITSNHVLGAALTAWLLAQFLKVPLEYITTRRWNWALWFSAGGMPSSHSALIVSVAIGTGLYQGFDSPVFALAVAIGMIVVYDATGVRREAGKHAEKINAIIDELFAGHQISEDQLKEVLGHTPRQVVAGVLLGLFITLLFWAIWK